MQDKYPDSKVHGANMGSTWVLSALDGPHVGLMNLAIRVRIIAPHVYFMAMRVEDIKNNAWVTVNNDFWVTSVAICQ